MTNIESSDVIKTWRFVRHNSFEKTRKSKMTNIESSDVIKTLRFVRHNSNIKPQSRQSIFKYILIAWYLHGALHCYCASLIVVYLNGGELSVLASFSLGG